MKEQHIAKEPYIWDLIFRCEILILLFVHVDKETFYCMYNKIELLKPSYMYRILTLGWLIDCKVDLQ